MQQLSSLTDGSIFDQARCATYHPLRPTESLSLISSDDLYVLAIFVQHQHGSLNVVRSRVPQIPVADNLQWYLPSVLDALDTENLAGDYDSHIASLFSSSSIYDLMLAVVHPSCPLEILDEAYVSPFPEVRQSIARRAGEKDLLLLAHDMDVTVVQAAVFDQHLLPLDLVFHILDNPTSFAAAYFAQRPDTTPDYLALLGDSSSPIVQAAVAAHPRLPLETQRKLVHSQFWQVRKALTQRKDLHLDVKILLADDPDPEVSKSYAICHLPSYRG